MARVAVAAVVVTLLALTASACSGGDDGDGSDAADPGAPTPAAATGGAGDGGLSVGGAWAAEATDVAAVYLTVTNGGTDDHLVGATTDAAGAVSVMSSGGLDPSSHASHDDSGADAGHDAGHDAGAGGASDGEGSGGTGEEAPGLEGPEVAVPAGTTELAPGGAHLMLEDLAGPLRAGDTVTLELDFAEAGHRSVEVEVLGWDEVVERMDAAAPDGEAGS